MPPKKRAPATKLKEVAQETGQENEVVVPSKSKKAKITNGDGEDGGKKEVVKRSANKQKKEPEPEVEQDEVNEEKIIVRRGKRNIKDNPEASDETEIKKSKPPSKKKNEATSDNKPEKAEKVVKQPKAQKADSEELVPKKRGGKKTKEPESTENGNQDTQETKKLDNKEQKQTKKRGKTPIETESAEQAEDEPVAKQRRGKKAKEIAQEDDADEDAEPPKKAGRKKTEKPKKEETKPSKAKKTKKEETASDPTAETDDKKNKTTTEWSTINFSSDKINDEGNAANFKITSWNVDGLRAWLKKDGMNILHHDSPDILCLQETKCSDDDLPEEVTNVEGYKSYWCASNKKGYAGVGILTKKEPIRVVYGIDDEEQDEDGRCITAEFEDFFLVNVYVPNAGKKLVTLDKRLDWNEKFKSFMKQLDETKPVIVCGDMNVAHNEIDLKNPKTNKKNAGFTQEERDGMTDFLESGFADTFRTLYPEKEDVFTFWTYMMNARKKNIGWRLDYFLVSNRFKAKVCDNVVLDQVFGSDHCPIILFINI